MSNRRWMMETDTTPSSNRRPRAAQDRNEGSLVREAFRRRAERAIARLSESAEIGALTEALAAPTDFGAVARALGDAVSFGSALDLDPLADALARGAAERERLSREAGGLLSAGQVGRALGGISRQAVDKRRRANQLLGVRVGSDWRYPAMQIEGDEVLPGLPSVLAEMADVGPWVTLDFLLTQDEAVGGISPLDALRQRGNAADQVRRIIAARKADAFG